MARAPVEPQSTPAGGRYLAPRTDCPSGAATCTHFGIDLHGKQGTPILAPEGGIVVVSRAVATTGYNDPPFSGYGPGVVLMLGDSGVWHLMGHVRPSSTWGLDP